MIDTTLASDNPLCFRKNLLERIGKIVMTIDDKILDEKRQYDIKREAAKISALSSGKIDKYEHLTGKEKLSSNQSKIIGQAKFTYRPIRKVLKSKQK